MWLLTQNSHIRISLTWRQTDLSMSSDELASISLCPWR